MLGLVSRFSLHFLWCRKSNLSVHNFALLLPKFVRESLVRALTSIRIINKILFTVISCAKLINRSPKIEVRDLWKSKSKNFKMQNSKNFNLIRTFNSHISQGKNNKLECNTAVAQESLYLVSKVSAFLLSRSQCDSLGFRDFFTQTTYLSQKFCEL